MSRYVYTVDMVKDLMVEVLEYVGELEHGFTPAERPRNRKALAKDFSLYLKMKYRRRDDDGQGSETKKGEES